jgi:hypothetical protein
MASIADVDKLVFLGAGRLDPGGGTVLATYSCPAKSKHEKQDCEATFEKILKSAKAKLEVGQHKTFPFHMGSLICHKKEHGGDTLVFGVVTGIKLYSEPRARELLGKFADSVTQFSEYRTCAQRGLDDKLEKKMKELLDEYSDKRSALPQGQVAGKCGNSCAVM